MEEKMKKIHHDSNRKVIKKLNVSDYVFEINGKDIAQAKVSYSFDEIEELYYKDGKLNKIEKSPLIYLKLFGFDSNYKEVSIEFEIKINLNKLNKFLEKPTDITKYILFEETYLTSDEKIKLLDYRFPQDKFEDIFYNLSSIYVSKVEENIFIFKVCIPNDLFAFFKVDFNE